jgi:hypothetical protein
MEKLLFGDSGFNQWRSPFESFRNLMSDQEVHADKPISGQLEKDSSASFTSAVEEDYVIDPITNRKVPKSTSPAVQYSSSDVGVDIPVRTFKPYEPQFTQHSPPIFYDGPPPESELKKYNKVEIDSKPWDLEHSRVYGEDSHVKLQKQQPVFESDEYEENHTPSDKDGHLSWKYRGIFWHQTDGIASSMTETVVNDKKTVGLWTTNPDYFGYEDLSKYKPTTDTDPHLVSSDEATVKQPTSKYPDLDKYKAFRYQEPDGRPTGEASEQLADLDKYKPVEHNEPEGKLLDSADADIDVAELRKYQSFEPDSKPPGCVQGDEGYDARELDRYEAFRYNEPDGKPLAAGDSAATEHSSELRQYSDMVRFNEPDGKQVEENTSGLSPAELDKYEAVRWNEPDGKAVEEVDSVAQSLKERDEDLDLLRASDVRASAGNLRLKGQSAEEKATYRKMLESSLSEHSSSSDAIDTEAVAAVKKARQMTTSSSSPVIEEKKMTGNYVRDFPEEFSKTWSMESSSLLPEEMSTSAIEKEIQKAEREEVEGASFDNPAVLQPALDRRQASRRSLRLAAMQQPVIDPYSHAPQGMETSYVDECGGQPITSAYVKSYGDVNTTTESFTAEADATEPTVYKILAYDPTMQAISTAETTSVVPDSSAPLTPAEVLLRLSNPTKFFPHFAPLRAQGFEIVSGSGDVLVFRKVRGEQADAQISETAPPPVNPIDMTGGNRPFPTPAMSRFASPTGFVNYDLPPAPTMEQSPPRFVSGIDVRREEPVFSGSKTGQQQEGRKKASLPKRMAVGAVWVAGISYALGVVGEYFTTGGMDGKGPTGL